jgi:hypothetical protein
MGPALLESHAAGDISVDAGDFPAAGKMKTPTCLQSVKSQV